MTGKITFASDGKHYFLDGKEVTKAAFDKAFPPKPIGETSGQSAGCWPMTSEALAVHPKQVAQANERNRKAGLATRYDKRGMAVIPSRAERKALLKLEGFFDKSGGYGD